MGSSTKGKYTESSVNFDILFKEVSSLFEYNKLSLAQFHEHVDDTFKQIELEAKVLQVKPISMMQHKTGMRKVLVEKTPWKQGLAISIFILTASLILASLPVFYDSSNNTFVSNFFNDPYVQSILPKEYGHHLGVFYMNLRFKIARILRSFVTYMGMQHMIRSFGSRGNAVENARQCFLANPIVQKHTQPCSHCYGTEEIIYYPYQTYKEDGFHLESLISDGNIHVFELSGLQTSLYVLQQHVSNSLQAVQLEQHSFTSNISYVRSVKDLGKRHIISQLVDEMPLDGQIIWKTEHYTASHLMRQVFPRPPLIPPSVTITLSKAILLDGPISPEYRLPMNKKMFIMYIQGFGSRKIRLIPPDGCIVKCSTHTVTTQTSDILIFDGSIWAAYSLPNEDHDSFAYVSYISFDTEAAFG